MNDDRKIGILIAAFDDERQQLRGPLAPPWALIDIQRLTVASGLAAGHGGGGRDELQASIEDLTKRGAKMKTIGCGPKSRLCVLVDRAAGSFGVAGKELA